MLWTQELRRCEMSVTLEKIKSDLESQTAKQFYTEYIVKSSNWYFENILGKSPEESINVADDVKLIISDGFKISFNSIMMVGSGKIGYSLSPKKLFKPFNNDEKVRKISDLDFAIISSNLFNEYWMKLRKSFRPDYMEMYHHIYQDLYRGYISERNILNVDGCRKEWNELSSISKKELSTKLFIKNEISFRLYRSWEDFEEYNLQNIKKIKKEF